MASADPHYVRTEGSNPRPLHTPSLKGRTFESHVRSVGDAEVMLSEALEIGARAVEAGAPSRVALRVYRRMWHVFPMYTEAVKAPPVPPLGCSH